MEPSISIDVAGLERFLKNNNSGDEVVKALRYRTMVHWLHPELDRLSNRMLPVYEALVEHLDGFPFKFLDVGCMCGWLKHFIEQRTEKRFRYIGIDMWPEALQVAREFSPHIEVYQKDVLKDDISTMLAGDEIKKFRYCWTSNIQYGDKAPLVIEKLMNNCTDAAFFGMPDYCGDYAEMADKLGYKNITKIDCGEAHGSRQSLVIVKWQ